MLNLKTFFTLNKLLATLGLLVLGGLSLFVGIANIDIHSLISGDPQSQTILFSSRLPRLFAICLAGAGLSVAGLIMQQVCQNRFASPSTTGTIDCAMLGYIVSLVFLSGASQWVNLSVIFTFSVVGTLIFVRFLQTLKFQNTMLVPLIGIMYGNVISALATFIAYRFDLVQTMSAWTVANFSSVLQGNYEFLYLALPACIIAYYYASQFSAASVGESFAKNIGLDYTKIVLIGVVIVAILAATVVMIVGVIPFLGLIVPNLVALFMGDNMRRNLPWVAYWGIIMVLVCDVIGRVIIFPYEMPISMIISVFGGAVFIMLVLKDKSNA